MGLQQFFAYMEGKRYKLHVRVMLSRYRTPVHCPGCHGSRSETGRPVREDRRQDIHELTGLTIETVLPGSTR